MDSRAGLPLGPAAGRVPLACAESLSPRRYSPQPCTNLFSAEPDHVLAHRLAKTLTEVGGNADIQTGACRSGFLCDEAAIISNTVAEVLASELPPSQGET